jgi:hypothetical protein
MRLRGFSSAARPGWFIAIVLSSCLLVLVLKTRVQGLFACQSDGYSAESYLAYCHAGNYGDYDHGAFWFDLEHSLANRVKDADVLFLGNSRSQVAFSTGATADWFSSAGITYFLLGFYLENHLFERELLRKLEPQAKAYVINLDAFFEDWESPFSRVVLTEADAPARYATKRLWQDFHEPICRALPSACGSQYVVFRSRYTGSWKVGGGTSHYQAVSHNAVANPHAVAAETRSGLEFLAALPVSRECVIATIIPTVATNSAAAIAIAERLGLTPVIPTLKDLRTFDGSHLDAASAERWSEAFFEAAEPQLRRCLAGRGKS